MRHRLILVLQLSSLNTGPLTSAVFYTALVYRWGLNGDTGNFVPKGHVASSGVAENRMYPSTLCQFSYAFDTHTDKTLWNAQRALEDYVQSIPGFNLGQKKRRTWQDGSTADKPNSSFVFSSQIFVRRNSATKHREERISYDLHPWIAAATGPRSDYFANPDRPMLYEIHQGELRDIKECSPPYLKKGDLVWVSFTVEFIIGNDAWSMVFVPYEIVRVGSVSLDLVGDTGERSVNAPVDITPNLRLQAGMKIALRESFFEYCQLSEM
ncbi:hypothetical protein GY45DRAFT_1262015 [Cubamyces sp. BRFM 1775]|nr:hypothetical protein GY45DRAFT_1262015 [Cubamyces sp. BRFM 1775]